MRRRPLASVRVGRIRASVPWRDNRLEVTRAPSGSQELAPASAITARPPTRSSKPWRTGRPVHAWSFNQRGWRANRASWHLSGIYGPVGSRSQTLAVFYEQASDRPLSRQRPVRSEAGWRSPRFREDLAPDQWLYNRVEYGGYQVTLSAPTLWRCASAALAACDHPAPPRSSRQVPISALCAGLMNVSQTPACASQRYHYRHQRKVHPARQYLDRQARPSHEVSPRRPSLFSAWEDDYLRSVSVGC